MGSIARVDDDKKYLVENEDKLCRYGVQHKDSPKGDLMFHHNSE